MLKWLPLFVLMVSVGWLLLRTFRLRARSMRREPLQESQLEIAQRLNSPIGRIHQMETRLYDYGREVEGRVETTLAVLDRLIIDAQQESVRLEALLQQLREQEQSKAA